MRLFAIKTRLEYANNVARCQEEIVDGGADSIVERFDLSAGVGVSTPVAMLLVVGSTLKTSQALLSIQIPLPRG